MLEVSKRIDQCDLEELGVASWSLQERTRTSAWIIERRRREIVTIGSFSSVLPRSLTPSFGDWETSVETSGSSPGARRTIKLAAPLSNDQHLFYPWYWIGSRWLWTTESWLCKARLSVRSAVLAGVENIGGPTGNECMHEKVSANLGAWKDDENKETVDVDWDAPTCSNVGWHDWARVNLRGHERKREHGCESRSLFVQGWNYESSRRRS